MKMDKETGATTRIVGRYAMYDAIATGGMATVHLGRLIGPVGFSRTVAIKRLHAQFAKDPDFAAMFLDEAKVASRIRHPNVVPVIDVVRDGGEILLVMEYVHGESLASLLRADPARTPERLRIVCNVLVGALAGLHAAHEATGDGGRPLGIVHRDVSPQNVLVGLDGVTRVLDFGVAKAVGQAHTTRAGEVKGKVRYLSPEQIRCDRVDRRTDLWAASVLLWEVIAGRRLFSGDHDAAVLMEILEKPIRSPAEVAPDVPEALARAVLRGLERDPQRRFPTALAMAAEIEAAVGLAAPREIAAWVERVAGDRLEARRHQIGEMDAETVTAAVATGDPAAGAVTALSPFAAAGLPAPEAPRPGARSAAVGIGAACAAAAIAFGVLALGRASRPPGPSAREALPTAPVPEVVAEQRALTPLPSATAEPSATSEAVAPRPPPRPSGSASARRPGAGRAGGDLRVPLYGRD
jgi:hypothetical protein